MDARQRGRPARAGARPGRRRPRCACCASSTPRATGDLSVPDPYYGGPEGFARRLRDGRCRERRPARAPAHVDAAGTVTRRSWRRSPRRRAPTVVASRRRSRAAASTARCGRDARRRAADLRQAPPRRARRVVPRRGRRASPGWPPPGALRTPAVVAVGEGAGAAVPGAGVDRARARAARRPRRRFGRGLAALHLAGAPAFGGERDNAIGGLPQDNAPCDTWPEFYGRAPARRRWPAQAVDDGGLPRGVHGAHRAALRAVCPSCAGPPSLPRACTATSGAATR